MVQVHGKSTTVLYNGLNLSGDFTSIDVNQTVDTVDTSTMDPTTNQDHKFLAGMRNGVANFNVIWNDAVGAVDESFVTNLGGVGPYAAMMIPRNTVESRAYAAPHAILGSYNVTGGVSDAVKAAGSFQASGGFLGGSLTADLVARTVAGNTTGYRDSNSGLTYPTTRGGRAILMVTSITGGNVVVTLQQCATQGGAYTTLAAFASRTTVGFETIDIANGVSAQEFTRMLWTQTASSWTGVLIFTRY